MSDVVRMVLELKDNASPALTQSARAAEELASKEAKLKPLETALERVAAEAARVQRATEKAGAAVSSSMPRAGRAAKGAAGGMKRAGDRAKELGDKAGDADSVVLGLGGALGALSPEAGAAATALGDVFAATEAILRSGGQVARILGPVAVAVGALAAAYALLSKRLKEAEEAQRKASAEADKAIKVHRTLKDAALQAALATGDLTQEEFNRISAARTAADLFKDQLLQQGDEVAVQRKLVEQLQKTADVRTRNLLAAQKEAKESGKSSVNLLMQIEMRAAAIAELEKEESALARLESRLGSTQTAQQKYTSSLEKAANATGTATTATDDAAAAAERAAAAKTKEAEATRELKREIGELAKIAEGARAAFSAGLTPFDEGDIGRLDDMRTAIDDMERAAAELGDLAIKFGVGPDDIEKARDQLQQEVDQFLGPDVELDLELDVTEATAQVTRFVEWAQSQGITIGEGGVTTVAGVVNMGASAGSDPLGTAQSAAAATGPWGQLVAAILGALDMLGQKTDKGTSQITANILAADKALVDGVNAIPEFLENGLPRIIETTTQRVPKAIIDNLPAILESSVMLALNGLPEATLKAIPALIEAFALMLKRLWNDMFGRSGKGPSGSSTDVTVSAEQSTFSTVALDSDATAAENEAAFREGLSGGSGTSSARSSRDTVRRLQLDLANAIPRRFNDPAIRSLRRIQMQDAVAGASGQGLGMGGIHLHSEFFDGTAIDRIEDKLQRRQGQFGRAMPRPVFNVGEG